MSPYRTIVADPPWHLTRTGGAHHKNHRALTYPTMSVAEIAALPVSDLSASTAWLFLWTVNAYVEQSYTVARAWGFRPVTLLAWCKTPRGIGPGGMFATTTEFILYCRRGSSPDGRKKAEASSWFDWPRTNLHSRKPEGFYAMIGRHFPQPRLELFARGRRAGWDVMGNAIDGRDIREALHGLRGRPSAETLTVG